MTIKSAQTFEYKLTAIAPGHIGTGEVLSPMEYYLDPGSLVIYDPIRLFELHPDLMDQEIQRLGGRTFNLTSLKRELREALSDPRNQLYRAGYFSPVVRAQLTNMGRQGEVRLTTKTVKFEPFIPGSSLKGALRTAWAYASYRKSGNADLLTQLVSARDEEKDQTVTRAIFRTSRGDRANFDLLRALSISDTVPVSSENLRVVAERVLSASIQADGQRCHSQDEFKQYWIFAEALAPGTILRGRMSFDLRLLAEPANQLLGWSSHQRTFSPSSLIRAVNEFSLRVVRRELDYFQSIRGKNSSTVVSFYQDKLMPALNQASEHNQANVCYLSIGHGSGWHKLTLGLLLSDSLSPEQFSDLRQRLGLARNRLAYIYPKTRKVIMQTEENFSHPWGWIKLELEGIE
jgi:CRISPR-associated protein Csm5